jgi:Cytosine deaminase and related metal-dependent hydrolases
MADQLDKRIQIHLHESIGEITESVNETGKRPIERLSELGLVNASLMAVHAVHLTDEEITLFADTGIVVAHCPRSNLKLADGIARIHDLLAAGVTVGLGTDSAASNNAIEMPGEMRTAALLAKARAENATSLPAAAALRMATIEGAKTLGLDDDIGSIEAGKWADLVCIDLMHLNSQPVYDPLSQVVYTVLPQQISDVWVAGRHQVEKGKLVHIDENEIIRRTAEWRERIGQSTGQDAS